LHEFGDEEFFQLALPASYGASEMVQEVIVIHSANDSDRTAERSAGFLGNGRRRALRYPLDTEARGLCGTRHSSLVNAGSSVLQKPF